MIILPSNGNPADYPHIDRFVDIPNNLLYLVESEADYANLPAHIAATLFMPHKSAAIERLSGGCEAEIISGFYSSALGTPHLYQSERDDQLNLAGAVLVGIDRAFKCQDANGVWAEIPHTAAQLAQVLADGAAKKDTHLQRHTLLKNQIINATSISVIESIVW